MEIEDLIALAAHNLWIHVPQSARDRFFIILVRELARENRKAAEKRGIGKETAVRMPGIDIDIGGWQAFEGLR